MTDAFTDRSFVLLLCVAVALWCAVCFGLPDTSEWDEVDHHLPPGAVASRSPQWRATANAWRIGHPVCEWCGSKKNLAVHHVIPLNEDSSRELDPTNLITLCFDHHAEAHRCADGKIRWGECSNPNVREDAARNLMKLYGPRDSRTKHPPTRQLAL